MANNSSGIPTSLKPFLVVSDCSGAISFYQHAFGAVVTERFEHTNGRVNGTLEIDGASFHVGDEEEENGNLSPKTIGGSPVRMILVTSDPDSIFAKAIAAGATEICPVTVEESWKIGKLLDPFGHTWEIGHKLPDSH